MSRSVNDATRFTPTGPQAHSRSGLNAAAKAASPAALERVARLRAAAMKAQEAKLTRFDRIILAGRKVADRAHKTTLYFLITATVASGIFGVWATTSLIMFTRRKSRAYVADQMRQYSKALAEATAAEARGDATEDQIALLEKERRILAIEEKEANRTGWWYRWPKDMLLGGLNKEDTAFDRNRFPPAKLRGAAPPAATATVEAGRGERGVGVVQAVQEARRNESTQPDQPVLAKAMDVVAQENGQPRGEAALAGLGAGFAAPSTSASSSTADPTAGVSSWFKSWFSNGGGGGNANGSR